MKKVIVEKPWGKFEEFTHDEISTVKILSVNPGSSLSLQYHNHRVEFWRVLAGHPLVTIGKEVKKASPGEEFMIKEQEPHRLEAQNDKVQVLEISLGEFDENDIIRIEDKYGRV